MPRSTFDGTAKRPKSLYQSPEINHPEDRTHSKRFPLLSKESSWFNQQLIMDKSTRDAFPVRQLQNLHVPTEFVNFVFDVGV